MNLPKTILTCCNHKKEFIEQSINKSIVITTGKNAEIAVQSGKYEIQHRPSSRFNKLSFETMSTNDSMWDWNRILTNYEEVIDWVESYILPSMVGEALAGDDTKHTTFWQTKDVRIMINGKLVKQYVRKEIKTSKLKRGLDGELECPEEAPYDCNNSSNPSQHPSDCDNKGFPCECICHVEHGGIGTQ